MSDQQQFVFHALFAKLQIGLFLKLHFGTTLPQDKEEDDKSEESESEEDTMTCAAHASGWPSDS